MVSAVPGHTGVCMLTAMCNVGAFGYMPCSTMACRPAWAKASLKALSSSPAPSSSWGDSESESGEEGEEEGGEGGRDSREGRGVTRTFSQVYSAKGKNKETPSLGTSRHARDGATVPSGMGMHVEAARDATLST